MNRPLRFLRRTLAIAGKEAIHVRRDPRMLIMGLLFPVILLFIFGFGVRFDIDRIPLVLLDHDKTPASRELLMDFVASHEFTLVGDVESPDEIAPAFARHEAACALVVPPGYEADLLHGRPVSVQLLIDGSDPTYANQAIVRADSLGLQAAIRAAARAGLAMDIPFGASVVTRFNPQAESAIFLVPGTTAYLLAMVSVILTALSVAREWERGSMEQLFATPVGRMEIILGKLLPYLGLGVVQVLLVLTLGAWVFNVPFRGDPTMLAAAAAVFLTAMLAQGLFISIVTKNQIVATQAATMSSMLPSMLLSGFLFPVENMPAPLRAISNIVPARYFIRVLRGVLLKGNGWHEHAWDLVPMLIFAVFLIVQSARRFDRRIA